MKYILFALVLFLVGIPLFAGVIKSGSLQASSDGVNITLHWISDDETAVLRYEIERRSGTADQFNYLGTVNTKGASLYEYVDNTAFFKSSSLYQYRVKIYFSNDTSDYSSLVTVTHTVSGIRRTWGSIKAIFR